jgi:hypothetical protein
VGGGGLDGSDVRSSEGFQQLLELREPDVVLKVVPKGGHTMYTWRMLLPQMLAWMTPRLTSEAQAADARDGQGHKVTATAGGQSQHQNA